MRIHTGKHSKEKQYFSFKKASLWKAMPQPSPIVLGLIFKLNHSKKKIYFPLGCLSADISHCHSKYTPLQPEVRPR